MEHDMVVNNRVSIRLPYKEECALSGVVFSQTADMSEGGFSVRVNGAKLPIMIGDKLSIYVKRMQFRSMAEVRWTKRDVKNKATKIGLKLFPSSLY
jgi:hypothetical protein